MDPYAKDVVGRLKWNNVLFGYRVGDSQQDLVLDKRDSAAGMLKSRVIDPSFVWGDDKLLRTPWHDTIIYEMHVKGFTYRHPEVPPEMRGTYAALATEPVIE